MDRSGIKLEVIGADDAVDVDCRPVEISQVLLNLLTNACDAVSDQAVRWIRVELSSSETSAFIRIFDSGPGVPVDLENKIFQPFFSTKEVGKGTGLGLSISTGIIQKHRGKFFLDTNSDHTCFVIDLPTERKSGQS